MKKIASLLIALLLILALMPAALAQSAIPPERLLNLVHNAPNTGKMLPEHFDPFQNTYLLTVASWVSRITFTPTTSSPTSVVTVNGQVVASGQKSQVIQMTNDPQAVQITVSAYGAGNALTAQNTYTIYLQRRPSERRTRVSAGYITDITLADNGIATISADLVTLKYSGNTNASTFTNETVYIYKYKTAPNGYFYYRGLSNEPLRAYTAEAFANNYEKFVNNTLYTLVYIEDEIVAIFPYEPN